jgi:hypothetical protein
MSLQRIEAIAREQYETGQHGTRHLMLGLDVMEALKARAGEGIREPYGLAREGLDALTSIPVIVADEDTLEAGAWQLRENAGRTVVEDGEIGDDHGCTHEHSLDISERRDLTLRAWCIGCGAEWTMERQ